jgi:hypothetical protein
MEFLGRLAGAVALLAVMPFWAVAMLVSPKAFNRIVRDTAARLPREEGE